MSDVNTESTASAWKPVSQLKTAKDLCNLLNALRMARFRKEIDWRLNLAYYRGQQFSYWNPAARRIESLPTEDGEKPRYRVRMVSNQILPGTQSLLSKLVKTKPIFGATPGQPGDKAIKAAQFAETLLEMWWRDFELQNKLTEALLWSIHAGAGYWKITWDPLANKAMKFILGPDGNPIVDDALATQFKLQCQTAGIDPQEKIVYMGDLKVDVLSPFHVFGDPTKSDASDWKWVITQHNLDQDEVRARFKQDIPADGMAATPDQTLPFGNAEFGATPNVVKVYCGYFLPQPAMPKGRYVVWTEAGGQKILYDGAWPWPELTMLPVVQFQGIKVPGLAPGDALTTQARPLQKQLNRMLSQVSEYFNLTVRPQWIAPVNSLRTRMTNEPGVVHEYNPVGATNLKPEPMDMPSIPPYIEQLLADLSGRLRDIYGLTDVTEGTLPPNLEAADAIDLLQEMAIDKFAPAIESNERTIARAGQIMLNIAQKKYEEPRMLRIQGFGGAGQVKEFCNADFSGPIIVHVEAGSSLPRTRAARRQQIGQWMQQGLLSPQKAWKYYDLADIKDLAVEFAADEDHAYREHDKMLNGIPLNPEALQQATQAMQQHPGVNPQTGQPFQGPQEVQDFLQRAALQPKLVENLEVHLDTHAKYMRGMEFETLNPAQRKAFETHYEETLMTWRSLPRIVDPVAPKINVQLRSDVGPTTMADILKRSGVPEADPQILGTELPLENMVIDNVDKPNARLPMQELTDTAQTLLQTQEANSNAQLANAMQAHKHVTDVQGNEQQQQAQQEKSGHDLFAAQTQLQNQQELHAHAVRTAKAQADLAEKKARESSFKPKPTTAKPKPTKGK